LLVSILGLALVMPVPVVAFDSRIEGFSISDSRPPEEVFGS
jgi:hypothetical protein